MSYKVLDIANKLLSMSESYGDFMTNMKLQKMLYYQQGYHLALFDTPLFDDEIEAWMYGPVVPCVYEEYKVNENNIIYPDREPIQLGNKEEALFEEVFRIYDIYSATGLMNLTHSETPWKKTPTGVGNIISKNIMKEFFKKKLK